MQFLSRAFDRALTRQNRTAVILGATSGDTGSAALEAFKGRASVDVFILFPDGRVSPVFVHAVQHGNSYTARVRPYARIYTGARATSTT